MEMINSILNETESSIDRQWRDMEFCYEVMEQHREMEKFVNECLIMASGNKKAINEMYILNEAAFGDKVKAFFEKIKNFFKKIFDKLGASMSALFSEQKKYMEKYAYIITKCKWKAGDISDMKDHFVGIPRIIDMVNTNIETALFGQLKENGYIEGGSQQQQDVKSIDLKNIQPEEKKDIDEVKQDIFKKFIESEYWKDKNITEENDSNANVNIDATFRTYFDGSSDTITLSGDEVDEKFQMIINVTYAGQAYINKLEKIVTTVDKKMDQISKAVEDELNKMKDTLRSQVKNEPANNNKTTVTKEEIEKLTPISDGDNKGKIGYDGKFFDSKEDVIKHIKDNPDRFDYVESSGESKKPIKKSAIINGITEEIKDGKTIYKYSIDGKSFESDSSKDDIVNKVEAKGYEVTNESYIIELNISGSSKKDDIDNKSAANRYTGTGAEQTKDLSASTSKIGNMKVGSGSKTTFNVNRDGATVNDETNKKIDAYLESVVHNKQANVNALIQITSSITKAAFGSFKGANSDFWSIIKAHVQWYLSNPGAEKESENQTTRPKNLDINAGMSVDTKNPTPSDNHS